MFVASAMCFVLDTKPNLPTATTPRSRGPRNDRRNWAGEPSRDRNGDPGMMDMMT